MQFKRNLSTIALAVASVTVMSQAHAEENMNNQMENGEIPPISDWSYDGLYQSGGIQAERLMDAEVFGNEGEEIGNVENVILSDKNQIIAVIAQVGGLWDIGDTHIAVPWEEVELTDDGVMIPVNEDNVDDYELFANESYITKQDLDYTSQVDDDLATGPLTWKLSDLLDDYASIDDGIGYGYVDNALFSKNGAMQAIVVEPAGSAYGTGPYAYPFYGYGYGWNPGYSAYAVPYSVEDVSEIPAFSFEEYDAFWD